MTAQSARSAARDSQSDRDSIGHRYPAELEDQVTLANGRHINIRPIRSDDDEALAAFHRTLSPETVYRRYFAPHPVLSRHDLDVFTHLDYRNNLALVALADGAIVGVARYCATGQPGEAEFAVVVTDSRQHEGIGTALLNHLIAAAALRGVTRIVADVLAANHDVLNMLRHAGFTIPGPAHDGLAGLQLNIDQVRH